MRNKHFHYTSSCVMRNICCLYTLSYVAEMIYYYQHRLV